MEKEEEKPAAEGATTAAAGSAGTAKKTVASALAPIVILGALVAFLLWPGNSIIPDMGTPLPDVTIERVEFGERLITAYVRNTGQQAVEIVQADVNDRIVPAAIEPSKTLGRFEEAKVVIPFDWIQGRPYKVGVTTSDGTRFEHSVAAAVPTPQPTAGHIGLLALIGAYVGIVPVLIGLLWLPFLKQLSSAKYVFFLSLTAGLLIFLGVDALVEANEISQERVAGSFGGQTLIATVTAISFIALLYTSDKLAAGRPSKAGSKALITTTAAAAGSGSGSSAFAIALMIAVGIGLHNLGEGLAIGGAMVAGEVALSTFLIVGFAIHNTTEGLAIVAPLAREKARLLRLAALGLLAGAPAIAGMWIGGFISSPVASIVFLSVGAGAVFQVVYAIFKFAGKDKLLGGPAVVGVAAGMLLMYFTSLLV